MAPRRILVVEENQAARSGLTEILCAEGYNAHAAASGVEAMATASLIDPEVAIVDVELSDVDGITLIREVKQAFPSCSCVVTSAWTDVWIEQDGVKVADRCNQALHAGAVAFLAKPLSLDELLAVLKRTLAPDIC